MADYRPKKWSKQEDRLLWRLYWDEGLNFRLIANRLDRTERSVANEIDRLRALHDKKSSPIKQPRKLWYRQQGLKIGFLDIETSNLEANAGFVISWCLKVRGEKKPREAIITTREIHGLTFDKRILEELREQLEDVDIIVTYYGTGFDIPYLRTRFMRWGLEFPEYGTIYHFDLYYKVRSLLRLHRNSLAAACAFFGIHGKTNLDMEQWFTARVGDPKTLKYVIEHNRQDVIILEKLFSKLEQFSKWTRRSV